MKAESKDESTLSTSSIELESSFIERMNFCAKRVGSVSALAKKAGISQSGIRRYFSGGEPTRPHLISLSDAAGVRLEWLASGKGSPDIGAPEPAYANPDVDALEEIATKVLSVLERRRPELSAGARVKIVRLVCEFYLKQDKPMDQASLDNVIELAAFR